MRSSSGDNYNYGFFSTVLGVDLLADPDAIARDGVLAFRSAFWFWMTPQAPKPSAHDVMTGQWTPTAADLNAGRQPGFGMTVNIINGGLECGIANDYRVADRIGFFMRYAGLLGVLVGTNIDCENMQSYCPESWHREPMRPPARRFVEIVIVLVAWRAATAAAEPPATLRVRLDAPRTGVVRERIEGQLADLEVAIADADLACHAPLEARITYAAPDVDVLACVREQAGAISVEVIDVRARRAFVRRFSGGATSARAEEAAVALRGTLDALRLGGQLGVVLAPAPTEPPPFYDSPPESAPRGPNAVHIGGGLSSTAEGLGTELPLASYARLAFVHARLEVGVHGSLGLSRRRVFDEASIALTRHVLAIGLGYALVDTDHARLVGSGGVGLALRTRTTTTVSGGLLATARARRTDAFVHAGLRLQLSPRARGAFAFELGAGVEVPFSQASLAVQSGDVRTRLDRALPVFARFELGLLFRLDP